MDRLSEKAAIATGVGVGIGRACAIRMAEEGARIAIFDVLEKEGIGLATELASRGLEAEFWKVDVSDQGSVQSTINAAVSHFGRVDVLVNNAGISGSPAPMDHVTEAEWDRVQAVNVEGVLFFSKHAIPHLREAALSSISRPSSGRSAWAALLPIMPRRAPYV